MVEVGRFVDELKAAGVEFFAGEPVMVPYGCHCTDEGCPYISPLYSVDL